MHLPSHPILRAAAWLSARADCPGAAHPIQRLARRSANIRRPVRPMIFPLQGRRSLSWSGQRTTSPIIGWSWARSRQRWGVTMMLITLLPVPRAQSQRSRNSSRPDRTRSAQRRPHSGRGKSRRAGNPFARRPVGENGQGMGCLRAAPLRRSPGNQRFNARYGPG